MKRTGNSGGKIKSDETLLALFGALLSRGQAGVTELADDIEKSKGTVHKHLTTLEEEGWVVNEGGTYRLGMKFLTYGGKLRDSMLLYNVVAPKLKDIAEESSMTTGFSVKEQNHSIFIDGIYNKFQIRSTLPLGATYPLHVNAVGKAILGELSNEDIDEYIDQTGLPSRTQNTIVDRDELFDEVKQVREQGFALNIEEQRKGWSAVAVTISHPETTTIGAVSLAGPSRQLTETRLRDDYADVLLTAMNELYIKMNYE